jgi:hypothetical protein
MTKARNILHPLNGEEECGAKFVILSEASKGFTGSLTLTWGVDTMKFCTAVARTLTLGILMAFAGSVPAQQGYPNKPIHFITPYPPGGSTDPMARMFGQKLTESWGQQVIVDNRPGGNTSLAPKPWPKLRPMATR